MSDYRRYFVPGGTFFFTIVTYSRRPLFVREQSRRFLRDAITKVRRRREFDLFATVLLPDHWHLVMQLPPEDSDYATRIKRVKEEFTLSWLRCGNPEANVTKAQAIKGERGVWQPRFWEHSVQDEDDLQRCVDYIHWNPRRHGLVSRVRDYPWSSFHRFVEAGQYEIDWGGAEPASICERSDWGEPG